MQVSEYQDEYSRLLSIFGLEEGAGVSDIKLAYRRLAQKYHPDREQELSSEERDKLT